MNETSQLNENPHDVKQQIACWAGGIQLPRPEIGVGVKTPPN